MKTITNLSICESVLAELGFWFGFFFSLGYLQELLQLTMPIVANSSLGQNKVSYGGAPKRSRLIMPSLLWLEEGDLKSNNNKKETPII